jgi:hypothetical protein
VTATGNGERDGQQSDGDAIHAFHCALPLVDGDRTIAMLPDSALLEDSVNQLN